jgi:transcription termination/antitermination protein NusG
MENNFDNISETQIQIDVPEMETESVKEPIEIVEDSGEPLDKPIEIAVKPSELSEKPIEYKWYALRTFTGHEQKVKLTIESEIKRLKLQDKIKEIIIPQETVFEVRGGKRKTRIKNFLPGYILLKTILDKKVKDIVSNLPSVVSFVGTKTEPAPLQQHEIEKIIGRVEERKSIETIETSFEIGDPVKVIDGPFTNFNGTVKEINHEKQKLKVEVGILGRKTPVELDFRQVEIENH